MPEGETAREVVLEALAGNQVPVSATSLTEYLKMTIKRPPSRSTVRRALESLAEEGLAEQPYGSYYRITDKGRAYLNEELDASELED